MLQGTDAESISVAPTCYSPVKGTFPRSQAGTPPQLERASSSTDVKKGLIAALPRAAVRRGGFKVCLQLTLSMQRLLCCMKVTNCLALCTKA